VRGADLVAVLGARRILWLLPTRWRETHTWDAAAGEAAVVGAFVVVLVDVAVEVAFEAGEADVEVAGERCPPAFFEDQSV
jgi:hypothetical protein